MNTQLVIHRLFYIYIYTPDKGTLVMYEIAIFATFSLSLCPYLLEVNIWPRFRRLPTDDRKYRRAACETSRPPNRQVISPPRPRPGNERGRERDCGRYIIDVMIYRVLPSREPLRSASLFLASSFSPLLRGLRFKRKKGERIMEAVPEDLPRKMHAPSLINR